MTMQDQFLPFMRSRGWDRRAQYRCGWCSFWLKGIDELIDLVETKVVDVRLKNIHALLELVQFLLFFAHKKKIL